MDELLAGLGKWLSTAEFGTAGDWVGGVIGAAALFVAIGTQRRQQNVELRAESLLLRVSYHTELSSARPNQRHYIKLTSNSEKYMRDVSIVGFSPMPVIGLFARRDLRHIELLKYNDNELYEFRNDRYYRIPIGDIAPGTIVRVGFDAPAQSSPTFVIYYDDFKGTSWEFDTSAARRRKARWLYRRR